MSRKLRIVVIASLSCIVLALSFGAGYNLGNRGYLGSEPGLDNVVQAWNIIFDDYVDRDRLDADKLSQGAVRGMVEALDDPYTAFLEDEIYKLGLSSLEGKFEGIGAEVAIKDEQIVIVTPIANFPADKAGLKADDVILGIDGESTEGMSLIEVVLKIRGPKGTPVRLLILHSGEAEPVEIEVVRAEIELVSVYSEMMGDIAYIQITNFNQRTAEELSTVLQNITGEGARGIILDLRHNPGGLLSSAIDVTSCFIAEGTVVKVVDSEGQSDSLSVRPSKTVTDLPLIVLVDGASASGSEVVAGALRDNDRALLAGTRTYGKGSVQVMHQLKDGSGLSITVARWLTPNGYLIEGEGLSPDYELELEGEEVIEWAVDFLKSR